MKIGQRPDASGALFACYIIQTYVGECAVDKALADATGYPEAFCRNEAKIMEREARMPPPSDKPLQKVTLNLFRDDVAALVAIYGSGWTTEVRTVVANHVREHQALDQSITLKFGANDGQ